MIIKRKLDKGRQLFFVQGEINFSAKGDNLYICFGKYLSTFNSSNKCNTFVLLSLKSILVLFKCF